MPDCCCLCEEIWEPGRTVSYWPDGSTRSLLTAAAHSVTSSVRTSVHSSKSFPPDSTLIHRTLRGVYVFSHFCRCIIKLVNTWTEKKGRKVNVKSKKQCKMQAEHKADQWKVDINRNELIHRCQYVSHALSQLSFRRWFIKHGPPPLLPLLSWCCDIAACVHFSVSWWHSSHSDMMYVTFFFSFFLSYRVPLKASAVIVESKPSLVTP